MEALSIGQLLIENDIDFKKYFENEGTLLYKLFSNRNITPEIIQLLIDSGLDFNIQNMFGDTPLHILFRNRNITLEIIQLLIDHHVDFNIQNKVGDTPLHILFRFNKNITLDIIKFLVDNNIDFKKQRDEFGKTPLQYLLRRPDISDEFRIFINLNYLDLDLEIIYKESVCCICQDNEPDIIIQNCNHNCICSDCFSELQRSSSSCPMCREHIDNHTTIYKYAYDTSNIWIL